MHVVGREKPTEYNFLTEKDQNDDSVINEENTGGGFCALEITFVL